MLLLADEGSCFLFDIMLPHNFPLSPPKFQYISFTRGPRLNPNLYNEGKVCVSLLGTWNGREDKNEIWDPKQSSILQVLVSIQALILNEEPYYVSAWNWFILCSEFLSKFVFSKIWQIKSFRTRQGTQSSKWRTRSKGRATFIMRVHWSWLLRIHELCF